MSEAEEHRRKSEDCLRRATMTEDLNQRSLLVTRAAYWNELAVQAEERQRAAEPRER